MRQSPMKTLVTLKSRSNSTAPPTPPQPPQPPQPLPPAAPLQVLQRSKLSSRRPSKRSRRYGETEHGDDRAACTEPSGSSGRSDDDNLFDEPCADLTARQGKAPPMNFLPRPSAACSGAAADQADPPPTVVVVEWDTKPTATKVESDRCHSAATAIGSTAVSMVTPTPNGYCVNASQVVLPEASGSLPLHRPLPSLDQDQLLCVTHDVGGPLLIKAGAGSGKTQTIAHRIAYLMERGVPPFHILGLSFSRASAEALRDRVAAVLPQQFKADAKKLKMKTIHGFCFEMVRKYRDGGERLTVFDDKKRRVVARQAVAVVAGATNGGFAQARRDAETVKVLLQFVDKTKRKIPANGAKTWPMSPQNPLHQQFLAYEEILHQQEQACDFADLQWYMYQLVVDPTPRGGLLEGRSVAEELQRRFTHVIVDEVQDVDEVQYEILCRVAGDACRVSCVGDPRQAIYGFRGAVVNFFHKWSHRFGLQSEAQRMLNRNYRSVAQIVSASNTVSCEVDANCVSVKGVGAQPVSVVYVPNRYAMDERVLAFIKYVCATPRPGGGAPPSYRDIGILARKGATGKDCQAFLQAHGIPCRALRRRDPTAAVMMRSFLAHLRCVLDPHAANLDVIEALEYPPKCEKSFLTVLRSERKRRQDLKLLHERSGQRDAALPQGAAASTYFAILEELVDNQFMVDDKRLVPRTKKQRAHLDLFVRTVRRAHDDLHNAQESSSDAATVPGWLPRPAVAAVATAQNDLQARPPAAPQMAQSLFGLIRRLLCEFGFAPTEEPLEGLTAAAAENSSGPMAQEAATAALVALDPDAAVDDDGDEVDPLVDGPDTMRDVIFEALENLRATGEPHQGPRGMCALIDSMLALDGSSDYGPTRRDAGGAGAADGGAMAKALLQQEQRQNNRVTISTVHKAKGLEWPIVVVLDCTEGQMPITNNEGQASKEEQRIFYVAVSRAMEQLVLFAQEGPDRQPSRYLQCLLEAGPDVATAFRSVDTL